MRKKITMNDSLMDIMVTMSEGNMGALTVLGLLSEREDGFMWMLHLDDMNIRGSQIWIAFKYHCGQDIETLIDCCRRRDQDMIALVNKMNYGQGENERAVTGGATFNPPPPLTEADNVEEDK